MHRPPPNKRCGHRRLFLPAVRSPHKNILPIVGRSLTTLECEKNLFAHLTGSFSTTPELNLAFFSTSEKCQGYKPHFGHLTLSRCCQCFFPMRTALLVDAPEHMTSVTG